MRRQAIVVGLGQFGMALARSLSEKGVEVLAVDRRGDRVRTASTFAAEAVSFDATDEQALAKTAPERRDLCVSAIGDESREASIICTALFRQMGAKHIVARATDSLHQRILRLVGAHEVVNPEEAFGERYASRLVYAGIVDEIPLGPDLAITELRVPEDFAGKSLAELQLPRHHGITVIATRRRDAKEVAMPQPNQPMREDDILIVVAKRDAVARLLEKV